MMNMQGHTRGIFTYSLFIRYSQMQMNYKLLLDMPHLRAIQNYIPFNATPLYCWPNNIVDNN